MIARNPAATHPVHSFGMRDLTSANAMLLKAALLAAVGALSATLLFLAAPGFRTLLLIALTVWAFARVYYFAFYVVEKYIDPNFRFSGLGSVVAYLWRRPTRCR